MGLHYYSLKAPAIPQVSLFSILLLGVDGGFSGYGQITERKQSTNTTIKSFFVFKTSKSPTKLSKTLKISSVTPTLLRKTDSASRFIANYWYSLFYIVIARLYTYPADESLVQHCVHVEGALRVEESGSNRAVISL